MVCKNLLSICLKIILHKMFFVKNFVRNTCEFYNFIVWKSYPSIKICKKNSKKKIFTWKIL